MSRATKKHKKHGNWAATHWCFLCLFVASCAFLWLKLFDFENISAAQRLLDAVVYREEFDYVSSAS